MASRKKARKTVADRKVGKVMREFRQGALRSSSGQKVKSRKQAIAIGLSEAREAGARVPPKKKKRRKASASRR